MTIKPANEAACIDLQTIFGERGSGAFCRCQRYKLAAREAFSKLPVAERVARLQEQNRCGQSGSHATSGLVAFLDGEPVGWCAVDVGTEGIFAAAGLREVSRPGKRRLVIRLDFS